jgi:hypothetical protein
MTDQTSLWLSFVCSDMSVSDNYFVANEYRYTGMYEERFYR